MTDRLGLRRKKLLFVALLIALCPITVFAKEKPALQPAQMPYVFRDDRGSNWDVQPDGSIGDGGNDLFDGGVKLFVGDVPFACSAPQMDPSNNEIVFAGGQSVGLNVSRRVGCNSKLSYLRYTELLENPTANAIKTTIHINFNMGSGITQSQALIDEKKGKQQIGVVVADQSNCMALIGAGRGAKVLPRYAPTPGSDNLDVFWEVEVPAKQVVAITHLVCRRSNPGEAAKVLDEIVDRDVLKELSPDVAKRLANYPRGDRFIGDEELLRGELFDVIELRGGDQYKGTIKQDKYRLTTSYGSIELPADKVISEFTRGDFRPRQLLVTRDGEIFGGQLEGQTIKLELSNGQITNVPLSQITRMGYRKAADEPEELKFDKPFVLLRSGDRMVIGQLSQPIAVATRYGNLLLKPETISAVLFVSEEHAVHEVLLTDGSKFQGIITADAMEVKLALTGKSVSLPVSSIRRLQLAPAKEEEDSTASLNLANGDRFIGTLSKTLKLQTAFDTLAVNGAEIRALQRGKGSTGDVQITLWDNATLSGQLDTDQLSFVLAGGVSMNLPVASVEVYNNPEPTPSPQVMERIKSIVAELNADDWKTRDLAESQLVAIGSGITGVLNQMRPSQPAEAQQRIDVIIKTLKATKPAPSPTNIDPVMAPQPVPQLILD